LIKEQKIGDWRMGNGALFYLIGSCDVVSGVFLNYSEYYSKTLTTAQ
jgi:hypothetical protein